MKLQARKAGLAFFMSAILLVGLASCERASVRVPGASGPFPDVPTGFTAKRTIPATIEIAEPVDMRPEHYGEPVAGTKWTGCGHDTLAGGTAPSVVHHSLVASVEASKLFLPANAAAANHFVLHTDIDAFCAQVYGVIIGRVGGIVAMEFTLTRDGKEVWKGKIEHVVTDADKEYTGSQVTFIEEAMRVAMADSLSLVLRDLLSGIEKSEAATVQPGTATPG